MARFVEQLRPRRKLNCTRIVTLLMRACCEVGMKFDDEYLTGQCFAAFQAPSWSEAA